MRTPATDDTANQLLDYLASAGTGAEWVPVADLGEWESLYNLRGEAGFADRLADALAGRGLAEVRESKVGKSSHRRSRKPTGAELRLTPAGEALARDRARRADDAARELDWSALVAGADGPERTATHGYAPAGRPDASEC
jgi:hypothetical protein